MITTHLSPTPKQRKFLSVKKDVHFSLEMLKRLYQEKREKKRCVDVKYICVLPVEQSVVVFQLEGIRIPRHVSLK